MDHQKADDCSQENIASEYPCCGDRYDNRQICESSVCYCIKEAVPVGRLEGGTERKVIVTESLDQTHHKAGRHDRGQDRNEYVADGLQKADVQRLLSSSCCLYLFL